MANVRVVLICTVAIVAVVAALVLVSHRGLLGSNFDTRKDLELHDGLNSVINTSYVKEYNAFFSPCQTQNALLDYDHLQYIPWVLYKTGPLPYEHELMASRRKEWEDLSIKIEYFTDDAMHAFIANNFEPAVLRALDTLKPMAYKADLLRYCLLYKHGGIYSDLSQKFLVPLESLVDPHDELVLTMDRTVRKSSIQPVQINFMAARPGSALMLAAIDKIVHNVETRSYNSSDLDVTGPVMFGKLFAKMKCSARIDLYQSDGSTIVDARTGAPAISMYRPDHRQVLKTKKKCAYKDLWDRRQIYRTDDPPRAPIAEAIRAVKKWEPVTERFQALRKRAELATHTLASAAALV
uniref:Glycosyltransferase n=1 Tax=viral metagenome TaxID=1070528 RepID=A0A6C0KC94_9ZZZZ